MKKEIILKKLIFEVLKDILPEEEKIEYGISLGENKFNKCRDEIKAKVKKLYNIEL